MPILSPVRSLTPLPLTALLMRMVILFLSLTHLGWRQHVMDVTGIGAADNAMLAPVTKAFSFGMRLILGM